MGLFRQIVTATVLAVAISFSNLLVDSVQAADSVESITLAPTSKTYKVEVGQTFDDTLTVLNDGQTAYDFTVYAAPYSVTSGSYDPVYTSTAANADAYTWVQFKQTVWHIEPRETLKVPYTVRVRANASPGGHYGVLFAEVQPSSTGGSTLARKKRVGTIVYATVGGDVRLSGKSIGTDVGWFQSSAPIEVVSSVQNTGNSDFVTKVTYQVSDIFGSVKFQTQSDYVLLPSTTRNMVLAWSDAPWFGLYKARVTTAFLDQNHVVEAYVLIMPVWLVLLLGVTVVSGGIYALRRWSYSRKH